MLEFTLQRKEHQESWSEMGKRASLQTFLSLADGLATLRPSAAQAVVVSCGRYPPSPHPLFPDKLPAPGIVGLNILLLAQG